MPNRKKELLISEIELINNAKLLIISLWSKLYVSGGVNSRREKIYVRRDGTPTYYLSFSLFADSSGGKSEFGSDEYCHVYFVIDWFFRDGAPSRSKSIQLPVDSRLVSHCLEILKKNSSFIHEMSRDKLMIITEREYLNARNPSHI